MTFIIIFVSWPEFINQALSVNLQALQIRCWLGALDRTMSDICAEFKVYLGFS